MTESGSKSSSNGLESILNDPQSIALIKGDSEKSDVVKASTEVPLLLAEYAKQLSSEPFTGVPPHHGRDIEEVLNTSILRKFSNLSFDSVPQKVLDETEHDELANILKSLETFDASAYVKPVKKRNVRLPALEPAPVQKPEPDSVSTSDAVQVLVSVEDKKEVESGVQASSKNSPASEAASKTETKPATRKTKKSTKSENSKQEQALEDEADFTLSPSLYLMSDELTPDQKCQYSAVYDFLSLQHKVPKDGEESEGKIAQMLLSLHAERPKACGQLLKYFMGVLSPEDVALVKERFLAPSKGLNVSPVTQVDLGTNEGESAASIDVTSKTEAEVEAISGSNENLVVNSFNASNPNFHDGIVAKFVNTGAVNGDKPASATDLTSNPGTEQPEHKFSSMDEIWASAQALGLMSDDNEANDVVLVQKAGATSKPITQSGPVDGKVARYETCPNFIQFKWMFDAVKKGLKKYKNENGEEFSDLKLEEVTGKGASRSLAVGDMFISNHVFFLVADIGESSVTYKTKHRSRGQARIHVITDAGTESRPFDTSFISRFDAYKDSRRIVECSPNGFILMKRIKEQCAYFLQNHPIQGYIYILRSLSTDPVLVNYQEHSELLKIGYSTTPVEERIADAMHETTYLEAPVEVLATFECRDIDPRVLEQAIHTLLNSRRLNVQLKSKQTGRVYRPQEWFTISLEVASEVIKRILDGSIVKYHLNPANGRLIPNKIV